MDKRVWGPHFWTVYSKESAPKLFFNTLSTTSFLHSYIEIPRNYRANVHTESEFRDQKVTITITLNSPTKLISQTQTTHGLSELVFFSSHFWMKERKINTGIQSHITVNKTSSW